MRFLEKTDALEQLPGRPIAPGEAFTFRCHSGLACFNRCCRNLNLFLNPFDAARLRRRLSVSSEVFLEQYADVVLRPENHFPEVMLKMADDTEASCVFLTAEGCAVYSDRPGTCRAFPMEYGVQYDAATSAGAAVHFFRPPPFCLGERADAVWTPETWAADQEAEAYHRMTLAWAKAKGLFQQNPWGAEGPSGRRGRMAFMAAYNIDRFREFVLDSSFLKRFKVQPETVKQIRAGRDEAVLEMGFAWIAFSVWGVPTRLFKPKR